MYYYSNLGYAENWHQSKIIEGTVNRTSGLWSTILSIWLLEAPKIQKGQGIASNPSNNSISRSAGLALVKTVKPLDEANLVSAEMWDK